MPKKYLLWDFDHTLAYRDGMWTQTIYDLLLEYGYNDILPENIRPYLTTGFPWNSPEKSHKEFFHGVQWWDYMTLHFAEIMKQLGVKDIIAFEIAAHIKIKYLDIAKWHLYEDTLPCLQKTIEKGYENIIVSNHVPELALLAEGLGINHYFVHVFSSAQLGYEKPNIQIFKKVLAELEESNDVTIIGDNYIAAITGAIHAGIHAILVRKENTEHYPYYCKKLNDIFHILR